MDRRTAIVSMTGALATLAGCMPKSATGPVDPSTGRIVSRPTRPTEPAPLGRTTLPPSIGTSAYAYVPTTYDATKPPGLAVLFHGAGHDADELIFPLSTFAETRNLALVGVSSEAGTWDLIYGPFGPDIAAIDRALTWLFARVVIDPTRCGLVGFSDGATYALALGRVNGDFFRRVVAYSPGSLRNVAATGKPEFFITHGTQDQVLSIETTRTVIVPGLRAAGYSVEYREFNGGHGAPEGLIVETLDWFIR